MAVRTAFTTRATHVRVINNLKILQLSVDYQQLYIKMSNLKIAPVRKAAGCACANPPHLLSSGEAWAQAALAVGAASDVSIARM